MLVRIVWTMPSDTHLLGRANTCVSPLGVDGFSRTVLREVKLLLLLDVAVHRASASKTTVHSLRIRSADRVGPYICSSPRTDVIIR